MKLLAIILIGATLNALYIVLSTKLLRERNGLDASLNLIGMTTGVSGVILLPFAVPGLSNAWLRGDSSIAFIIFALALLMLLARLLHYEALRRIDLAFVAPFSAITPLATILTGYMILGESVGVVGVLGIALTSLGCALVYIRPLAGRVTGDSRVLRLGLLLALGSGVVPALAITLEKSIVLRVAPIAYSSVLLLVSAALVGLFQTCIADAPTPKRDRFPLPQIVLLSVLHGGSVLLFAQALLFGLAAEVSSMKRISIVFQVVLAYCILGQRSDILRRLIGVLTLIVGVAILHFL